MTRRRQGVGEPYRQFKGSTYEMWHDGALDEYRRCGATSADEAAWRAEHVAEWLGRLSTDDLTPLLMLKGHIGPSQLPEVIRVAWQGDSFARLKYAEFLWQVVEIRMWSPGVALRGRAAALALARDVRDGPIVLDPANFRALGSRVSDSGSQTPEDLLRVAADRLLAEIRTLPFKFALQLVLGLWLVVTLVVAAPLLVVGELFKTRRK